MENDLKINSKLPEVGTSIFAVMSKMANDYGAINLSQGFPDFNCSDQLIELVNHFMKKGFNQYSPMPGTTELRKQISKKIKHDYGRVYNFKNEITVTAGATQALYTAFSVFVNKGDEVIIFEPAYDSYIPAIVANGGIPVSIKLNRKDYTIPWEEVEKAITTKTKCIVINSPHNPTGAILKDDDIFQLEKLIRNKNIFLISDEVYEHINFNSQKHQSFARYDELAKRSFIISSFGKTFHTTGWKMGYCYAPEYLTTEFRKFHQFIVFAVNTPIQLAIAEFLKDEINISSLPSFYQSKRDLFSSLLKNSNFIFRKCDGTYFQLLDYSNISSKSDLEFAEYLTKEIGVAVIPLSPFYKNGSNDKLIRVCFAKKDEVLKQAAKKLNQL
ncbi:MAG: aminotransferase class I/II-fold pyridoxal phosphate-dependent enzyme [Ignavibacteriales bacterium]|nr:aminotransferase class I/II-fold pyridoxal phosphate-dependent enzyme [Ignavibacteriales bacterium]